MKLVFGWAVLRRKQEERKNYRVYRKALAVGSKTLGMQFLVQTDHLPQINDSSRKSNKREACFRDADVLMPPSVGHSLGVRTCVLTVYHDIEVFTLLNKKHSYRPGGTPWESRQHSCRGALRSCAQFTHRL